LLGSADPDGWLCASTIRRQSTASAREKICRGDSASEERDLPLFAQSAHGVEQIAMQRRIVGRELASQDPLTRACLDKVAHDQQAVDPSLPALGTVPQGRGRGIDDRRNRPETPQQAVGKLDRLRVDGREQQAQELAVVAEFRRM
jgi:hypothetical protein